MIELKNVCKRYKNNIALDNVSLNLNKNKVLGILGQNGAGKTTLMDIVCGCKIADSGTVSINGIKINSSPDAYKRQIAYVPELVPLYNDMTVLEYLHFVAELKKILRNEIDSHIQEILKLCSIDHVKNRLIANLSKGYRQRVGIAQALVGNAEVLVLDEPTAGLDPKQVSELLDLIKNLGKNHSIMISTHRISEIKAICDEYIILHKGVVKYSSNINDFDSSKCKIELNVASNQLDILEDINKLSFVVSVKNEGKAKFNNCELNRIVIECINEDLPEKQLNSLFASKGYIIYKLQRLEEDIEKIFLNITKEE